MWNPTGVGSVEDLRTITYMIYEGILKDPEELILFCAALLSKALIKYAQFEWTSTNYEFGDGIALKHNNCDLIAPVYELCVFRKTSNENMDDFPSSVFFDVLFGCQESTYSHPLIALSLNYDFLDYTYEDKFGYCVPDKVQELYYLYSHYNEEFLVRSLGLEVYETIELGNWSDLERDIEKHEMHMKNMYGKNWQQRARDESNLLA